MRMCEDIPFIRIDIRFYEKNENKSNDFKIPPFRKWKISFFNKLDCRETRKFIPIKRQENLSSL